MAAGGAASVAAGAPPAPPEVGGVLPPLPVLPPEAVGVLPPLPVLPPVAVGLPPLLPPERAEPLLPPLPVSTEGPGSGSSLPPQPQSRAPQTRSRSVVRMPGSDGESAPLLEFGDGGGARRSIDVLGTFWVCWMGPTEIEPSVLGSGSTGTSQGMLRFPGGLDDGRDVLRRGFAEPERSVMKNLLRSFLLFAAAAGCEMEG